MAALRTPRCGQDHRQPDGSARAIRPAGVSFAPVDLVIARGGVADVAQTDALIHEAADWLTAKGETLWGEAELRRSDLERVAAMGELVTGRIAGRLAACMFLHDCDPLFWPDDPPGEAFYVHRLAVARAFAGRGLSQAMLCWAEAETRTAGRTALRLDCEPRPKLLALYRGAGFMPVDCDPIEVLGHFVVRHQKRV
jgi:GNAT superfamily N-acetyltransferase